MAGLSSESVAAGVFVRRGFLSPFSMLKVLSALDRLSASWASSEDLGLLGRGQTGQIRVSGIAAQAQMDEIRQEVAPAVLQWARNCGFQLPAAPFLQLFPVRMVGDAQAPAYQEPHVDSNASRTGPPICTNVFYVRTQGIDGGDIAVARGHGPDLSDPLAVHPTANTIVSFAGDRVHWVEPLFAGERLSVVINFY
jgi:2OG-Fe(II) oxygenase superfamily